MIYIYFYRIEISKKSSFYKRNFLNQLIKLVDISDKLERCYEIEKADIVFTIGDLVNESELIGKKLVVYSLQDNSFRNSEILNNTNVLFVLDHCKNIEAIEENNDKIFCLLNISELYKRNYSAEVLPISQRKYDVVFMGTTQYDEKISKHRQDVIKNIEEVCIRNNLQCYTSDKPKKYSTYMNILHNTKIFVSPYGWGEFSLKEYECICSGAHILKPKIYFQYYPDYCANMDDFEIDFSNFESKILHILANLEDAQKKVDSNRKMFLDYCEHKHCAELENKIINIFFS